MAGPIVARAEAVSPATPAVVYALLADLSTMPKWRPGVTRIEVSRPGPAQPGILARVTRGAIEERWTVTQARPPWGFAVDVLSEERGHARSVYAFEPTDEGTRIVRTMEFDPVGHERWFRGWATKDLEHALEEEVAALAAHVARALKAA